MNRRWDKISPNMTEGKNRRPIWFKPNQTKQTKQNEIFQITYKNQYKDYLKKDMSFKL